MSVSVNYFACGEAGAFDSESTPVPVLDSIWGLGNGGLAANAANAGLIDLS